MKCRRIEEIEVWLANHGHWAAFKWLSFISSSFNMPFTSIYYFCNSHLSFHEKPWCQNAVSLIWCCVFDLVSFPSRTCLALSGALYLNCSLRCSWSSSTLRSPSYWNKALIDIWHSSDLRTPWTWESTMEHVFFLFLFSKIHSWKTKISTDVRVCCVRCWFIRTSYESTMDLI